MPVIRKSADLRNNYGEISEFCHNYREPVFITKNGQGDLAVMGIETYLVFSKIRDWANIIKEIPLDEVM